MIQLDDKWSVVLPSSGLDSLILLVSQQSERLIAAYAYTIYSFDIDNGNLAWKYEAEEPINDLHQEDNFLIVQTETGLIKLDEDGFIIWTFDLSEIILKVSLERSEGKNLILHIMRFFASLRRCPEPVEGMTSCYDLFYNVMGNLRMRRVASSSTTIAPSTNDFSISDHLLMIRANRLSG